MLNTLTTREPTRTTSLRRGRRETRTRAIATFLARLPGAHALDPTRVERTLRAAARETSLALGDRHPGLVVHATYVFTLAATLKLDVRRDADRLHSLAEQLSADLRPVLESTRARRRGRQTDGNHVDR